MAEAMNVPFFRVNVLTGTKGAKVIEDPKACADVIRKAKRPLLAIGARAIEHLIGDKLHLEYCLELAKKAGIPVCATAHVKKKALEFGTLPESVYDLIEIIHLLKFQDWKGVRKEGNHDLVIFSGVRCDLGEQGFSTSSILPPISKQWRAVGTVTPMQIMLYPYSPMKNGKITGTICW